MLESLFAFLFKYRPVVFERGDFVLLTPGAAWVVAALLAVAVAVAWSYGRAPGTRRRDRAALVALRLGVLALLGFCLLRPALRLSSVVPRENFVAVLLDDSRSMRIPDETGGPRAAFVERAFAEGAPLRRALGDRFQLRFFRFSSDAQRVAGPAELTYAGGRTDLGGALERVRQELAGLPLSGVVLVSDGADNGREAIGGSLLGLRAAGVPVFTVGLGSESVERDIQVDRVDAPRTATRGSTLVVDV
ncbi:MAG TPA: vWA domain-containing protein, partial [Planctomycetota bacterium]|nr:vWA domain-containing protein [Planctomycetota bacterium]